MGAHEAGQLSFVPGAADGSAPFDWGIENPLGLERVRDGVVYVPDTANTSGAPPIVFLHGAGGTGRRELRAVLGAADRYGAVVIAPDSRGPTWDVIQGGFGPDPAFIDRALAAVAERIDLDWARLAIGGISDGASYALSLGVTNGSLFRAIVAFSAGFIVAGPLDGKPPVYVSHGTLDPVLPIDACGRRIVASLQVAGYDVTYHEFEGGHTVPAPIADEGFGWWLSRLGQGSATGPDAASDPA